MVESIGTQATLQAQQAAASQPPRSNAVEQAVPAPVQSRVNGPDAPAYAAVNTVPIKSQYRGPAPPTSEGSGEAAPSVAERAPLTPLIADSGLTTYRDQESGRLIVRVFDRESGDVLLEFPPEGRRQPIRTLAPPASGMTKTDYLA